MLTRRSTSHTITNYTEISDDDIENYCINTPRRRISSNMLKKNSNINKHCTPVSNKKRQTKDYEKEEIQNIDVSPPKQQKIVKTRESLFSPSRLIERLSIEDEEDLEESNNTAVIETPRTTNKYHSASKVLTSGETNMLPGREKEFAELEQFLNKHIENETSGSLYVSGQPGTGKTACISKLLKTEKFSSKLKKIYINCTSISTTSIYKKILTEIKVKSTGKTEKESLTAIEKYLKGNHKQLLLVLDEIDQLCSSKQSVLYTIFEWPSKAQHRIILIGIANSLDLVDRMLVRLNAKCNLKPKLMHFASYSKQQIIDIFKSRLEEANVIDIFPPATIQLLAGKVASISGDIRRALDIGRRVIEMADRDGKTELNMKELGLTNCDRPNNNESSEKTKLNDDKEKIKPVQVKQVASVLNNVYGTSQTLNNDTDYNFPLQQKILLCSLLLMLRKSKNKDITVGRLHDVYRRVCAKRNILSVDQAEFASLCSLVDTRGIIRLITKKEPRLSKIALQWDQTEVTDALKDKQLIATILDDDSCLGGR